MDTIISNLTWIFMFSLLLYPILFLVMAFSALFFYSDCWPPLDTPTFQMCTEQLLMEVPVRSMTVACWKFMTILFVIWRYAGERQSALSCNSFANYWTRYLVIFFQEAPGKHDYRNQATQTDWPMDQSQDQRVGHLIVSPVILDCTGVPNSQTLRENHA